jgi:hypothetical protein
MEWSRRVLLAVLLLTAEVERHGVARWLLQTSPLAVVAEGGGGGAPRISRRPSRLRLIYAASSSTLVIGTRNGFGPK